MNKRLKKYLSYKNYKAIVVASPAAVVGVFCMMHEGYIMGIISLLLSGFIFMLLFRTSKFVKELESDTNLPQITVDFERAYPMRNDTVRFGNTWIFPKGQEKVVAYSEISEVYLNIVADSRELFRTLMYVDTEGKKSVLCGLELNGKSNAEMDTIMNLIRSKNPMVKGYRVANNPLITPKQLRKYISKGKIGWRILSIFTGVAILSCANAFIKGENINSGLFVLLLALFLLSVILQKTTGKYYKELENSGYVYQVLTDFECAYPMCGDMVRFGNTWIFPKGGNRIITYEDVVEIDRVVSRNNNTIDCRSIVIVDNTGKQGGLCSLKLRGNSDTDVEEIIKHILSKNPRVRIGCR